MTRMPDPTTMFSKEAEAAVLGSMIIDVKCIPLVLGIITKTEMFFETEHQVIFDALVSLYIKQKPTDAVMLRTELKRIRKLDKVGGVEYLAKVLDSVPISANAEYYADIVRGKYNYRNMIRVVSEIENIPDHAGDVNEMIDEIQNLALSLKPEKEIQSYTFKDCICESVAAMADRRHQIKTGFRDLDRIIGGFYEFEFVLLAARPGQGKTSLALDIGCNVAKSGKKIIMFSLEMSAESLMQRVVCSNASVNGDSWQRNFDNKEYSEALEVADKLSELDFVIYETIEDINKMISILTIAKNSKAVDLVIIDNIQLVSAGAKVRDEYERLTLISRMMKYDISLALHVPVLCISHLNRRIEERQNHRPMLSDLKGSGALEQNSDIILFLHREDQYRKQKNPDIDPSEFDGIAEISVAKNRRGRTGTAKLVFRDEYTAFSDIAPEYLYGDQT